MELSRVLYGIESLKFRHKGLSNVVGIIIILPTIFYTTHKWAKKKLRKIISTYVKCVWKTKTDKLRTNLFLALYKKIQSQMISQCPIRIACIQFFCIPTFQIWSNYIYGRYLLDIHSVLLYCDFYLLKGGFEMLQHVSLAHCGFWLWVCIV